MNTASEAFILLFWASTVTPGGAKCFLSSFLLHYLSTLSHQGHSSSSPPPTTTGPLRWRIIMCCYLPPSPPWPVHLYSPPALQPLFHTADGTHPPSRVVIFSHARLGCDDTHFQPSWNVESGFLPPECLWQRCCVGSVLPVWTEGERKSAFHTRSSFASLAAIVWEINFHIASQLQYMGGKKELHFTRPVCGEPDTLQQRFFSSCCTPESYSNCESSEFKSRWWEITAADIQMLSLLKLWFMVQAPPLPHHVLVTLL